jgi:hypothetical protein
MVFLDKTPKVQGMKEEIDKQNCSELKAFLTLRKQPKL